MSISDALADGDWKEAKHLLHYTNCLQSDPDALHLAVCLENIPHELVEEMVKRGYQIDAISVEVTILFS